MLFVNGVDYSDNLEWDVVFIGKLIEEIFKDIYY